MKIFEHSTANNPILKIVFAVLFITFPIIGFIFGMQYQSLVKTSESTSIVVTNINPSTDPTQRSVSASSSSTQTINISKETENWPIYVNRTFNYSFKYPTDWEVFKQTNDDSFMSIRPKGRENIPITLNVQINSGNLSVDKIINNQVGESHSRQKRIFNNIEWVYYHDDISSYESDKYFTAKGSNYYEAGVSTLLNNKDIPIFEKILSTFQFDYSEGWKTYIHNKFADSPDFKTKKGFTLYYPQGWTLKEDRREAGTTNNYPFPFLNLILSKSNGDFIEIGQGVGGGGFCLFPDQIEYSTFKGMATQYKDFKEIMKNNNIIWRLADWSVINNDWSHQLCEKFDSDMFKVGYMDSTAIGSFKIKVTTPESIAELNEILDKLEIIN